MSVVQMLREGGETLLAAVAWSSCSISMSLLNKMAVSRTAAPLAVVALQARDGSARCYMLWFAVRIVCAHGGVRKLCTMYACPACRVFVPSGYGPLAR